MSIVMQIKKNVLTATLAGAVMLASAGPALAAPATSTANVNVRSGPGGGYDIVDVCVVEIALGLPAAVEDRQCAS
jgi:uncharacterized protein YraI